MANLSIARERSSIANPIDIVEELVSANEWAFERASDEEMLVEVVGRWASYRMHFVWQQDLSSMYFSCLLDAKVPSGKRAAGSELVALINERMWLGHFEIGSEDGVPLSSRSRTWSISRLRNASVSSRPSSSCSGVARPRPKRWLHRCWTRSAKPEPLGSH
jgi:hypothetical protein